LTLGSLTPQLIQYYSSIVGVILGNSEPMLQVGISAFSQHHHWPNCLLGVMSEITNSFISFAWYHKIKLAPNFLLFFPTVFVLLDDLRRPPVESQDRNPAPLVGQLHPDRHAAPLRQPDTHPKAPLSDSSTLLQPHAQPQPKAIRKQLLLVTGVIGRYSRGCE